MKSYGKRLSMLLERGRGPHRYYGRWTMEGDILGYKSRSRQGSVGSTTRLKSGMKTRAALSRMCI
jgi:hypothetical protein